MQTEREGTTNFPGNEVTATTAEPALSPPSMTVEGSLELGQSNQLPPPESETSPATSEAEVPPQDVEVEEIAPATDRNAIEWVDRLWAYPTYGISVKVLAAVFPKAETLDEVSGPGGA